MKRSNAVHDSIFSLAAMFAIGIFVASWIRATDMQYGATEADVPPTSSALSIKTAGQP